MLKGIPLEEFARVGQPFIAALAIENPEFQSYHNVHDTVGPGVEILADLHVNDGLDILLDTVMSPGGKWGFKRRMFYHALPLYGGNAKPYIPRLEKHKNIPGRGKELKKREDLVKAIEEGKDPAKLISFAEAIRTGKSNHKGEPSR